MVAVVMVLLVLAVVFIAGVAVARKHAQAADKAVTAAENVASKFNIGQK
jgi:hypothetical protein